LNLFLIGMNLTMGFFFIWRVVFVATLEILATVSQHVGAGEAFLLSGLPRPPGIVQRATKHD
jgi:hypothetical protein